MESDPDRPPVEQPLESNQTEANEESAETPRSSWSAWLAWAGILGTIVLVMVRNSVHDGEESHELPLAPFEIQAKCLIGLSSFGIGSSKDFQKDVSQAFESGPIPQRLIGIILTSELSGPELALKSLHELNDGISNKTVHASKSDLQVISLVEKIQQARLDKKDLKAVFPGEEFERDSKLLRSRLGWVGRLALLPSETDDRSSRSELFAAARRAAMTAIGVVGVGMMALFCGVVLQIIWWTFVFSNRVSSGIGPIHANHVIYAETFAIWMLLYILMSRIFALPVFAGLRIGTILIPQIGSLIALAWPVIRGVKWQDMRTDIGLTLGRPRWTVPFVGIATYLAALPVVLIGVLITLAMMAISMKLGLADENAAPVHPIVEPLLRGSWSVRLQFVLIAIFAAVPEEIMFRGVMYRHLREVGTRFGHTGSIIFAMLVTSFVFAAIHPQGVFGIPVLMSLAIVFSVAREWRGSLVPSMIAHAMVNAGTTTVLLLLSD